MSQEKQFRAVVHLDADAFFASVEQAADPRLRGKPVAVGGDRRGIIASASYEARRCGIYTPMPTSKARKLCPKLIVLPGDYEKYERFSQWMFSYAYDFTPDVEVTSIDEGYLDLTGTGKDPVAIAHSLRNAIRQSLKITISEGIGSNKLVSQIASKLNKPASFATVPPGRETAFLHPLPNRWLPGVGPATSARLNAAGLQRIGQIATTPAELLNLAVGADAKRLLEFARGIDPRPIIPFRPAAKSYSQQETFNQDQTDETFINAVLRRMADRLMSKVRSDGKAIRCLSVKVRYNDMDQDECSESLIEPTDLESDLYARTSVLLRKAWRRRVSLRMVSLKLSGVYEGIFRLELPLDRSFQQDDARRRLAKAVDELRNALGYQVIQRGHDLVLRDGERTFDPQLDHPTPTGTQDTRLIRKRPPLSGKAVKPLPLGARSYYSFLNSTLSPQALVDWAKSQGLSQMAMCDIGNLHGAPGFAAAAQEAGIQAVIGAECRLEGRTAWLYAMNSSGYSRLCSWLSAPAIQNLSNQSTDGLIAVSADPELAGFFPGRFYRGIRCRSDLDQALNEREMPCVPMMPAHYGSPADRLQYDVAQSIRTLTLLGQPHPQKQRNNRLHLRTAEEMQGLFQRHPKALANTREIAERCAAFSFPFGPPQFPSYSPPGGVAPSLFLRRLAFDGAHKRYQGPALQQALSQLDIELGIIQETGYAEYFLAVWDLLQQCKALKIPWITRGSAADSLVCYCLEISSVCPIRFDLYFKRFLNRDRMALNKLPDIDIDFPHDRKDDVVDLLFQRYGANHCAVVGGFSTYHGRSALGDVAKVLGVSERQIRIITAQMPGHYGGSWGSDDPQEPGSFHLPPDVTCEEPCETALRLARLFDGFPRHAKMHPCGVVLSRQPIHDLTPTFPSAKGYPTTHYDMDAVEAIGLVKMDILAQGGLAVMRDVEWELKKQGIGIDLNRCVAEPLRASAAESIPATALQHHPDWTHPDVWKLIASGGARAVHHIESPAMISLSQMCQPSNIDTLVAIVSVIRPGAANEQKKSKFALRCQGMEKASYPHPCLEPCLRSTHGLVVYEEHILQICEAFAGLNGGRADVLRRSLVKQKWDDVKRIETEFVDAARARGHSESLITEVWELVTGFNGYAFCRAHSTAYGVEAYQSAWLKLNFPAEFMASVLTHGKGFYSPLAYILECHRLGIRISPPWINAPGPAFQAIRQPADPPLIRIPALRVKHLGEITSQRILSELQRNPFSSLQDFYLRTQASQEEMESLLRSGAFDGFGKPRTTLFWEWQQARRAFGGDLEPGQGWLLPPPDLDKLPEATLSEPSHLQRLEWEMDLFGFTASGHPLELYPAIAWNTYCPIHRLGEFLGEEVVVCGLVIEQRTHHQVTGELMKFMTICDWTGIVETELFADSYRSYGQETSRHKVLELHARVEPFDNHCGHTLRILKARRPREQMS